MANTNGLTILLITPVILLLHIMFQGFYRGLWCRRAGAAMTFIILSCDFSIDQNAYLLKISVNTRIY